MTAGGCDPAQGREYTDFIDKELDEERARSARLISRAVRLQQAGGAVLAVLAATISLSGRNVDDSPAAVVLFGLSAVIFIIAMVCGLRAERLLPTEVGDETTLGDMLGDRWGDDSIDSRLCVARLRVTTIRSLREASETRVGFLERGAQVQIVGIALAALGLVLLVLRV